MSDQDDLPQCSQPHATVTPRSSLGSGAALSFSSGSSISPSSSSSSQGSAKSAVSECLGAWLNYLQILNNLCSSGYRLAQTISTLEQWINADQQTPGIFAGATPQHLTTSQFTSAWDDLARATVVATSTVKSHIVTVLQDYITQSLNTFEHQEGEVQRIKDHNQQVVMENAQTMINLQHQFCVASYDSFSHLMCCFVCQAPVGCAHDPDCALVQPQAPYVKLSHIPSDPRSQTPSPHFGCGGTRESTATGSKPYSQEMYRMPMEGRALMFGSGSTQSSSDHSCSLTGTALEQTRGPSPHHDIRGPSPIQGFLETIRGPLPNPGHLLGMKAPFYRGSRSPLNFPMLFPLNQRRWSEAAAGEVSGETSLDAESQMRRWSMPWEASKSDRSTVSWHQTRLMPMSKLAAVPISKSSSDRSQSTTPDSVWQSSVTSQDGLAEAIQLLSCRPVGRPPYQPPPPPQLTMHQPPPPPPFIEEPHTSQLLQNIGPFGMWPTIPNPSLQRVQERQPPFIKFPPDKPFDSNPQQILYFSYTVPGPSITELIRKKGKIDYLPWILACCDKYGQRFSAWLGKELCLFLTTPDDVKDVLSNPNLIQKSKIYELMQPWLGEGLLTSGGAKWIKNRKLLLPAFHFDILKLYQKSMEECSDILVKKLSEVADERPVDIQTYSTLFTLDVICETAMGVRMNFQDNDNAEYVNSSNTICEVMINRAFSPILKIPFFFNISSYRKRQDQALHVIHGQTRRVLELRRKKLTDDKITMNDIFGQDTSSNTLSFVIYTLSHHREFQEQVYQEALEFEGHETECMKYLEAVIKETLRLYPPVPCFARVTTENIKIGNLIVPPGVILHTSAYALHRNPEIFTDPDTFNPERFINATDNPNYAFVPFSAGIRNCIGQKFAMIELKVTLAKVLRHYEILPVSGFEPILSSFITLISMNGVQVRIKKRC
ncbi:uncharacterized protein DMENIID0001_164260 [Sergentomyia squamirostris]